MLQPRHIVFCILPELPLFCIASALEVLRHANRFSENPVFNWTFLCENNEPVQDSNGLWLHPGSTINEVKPADYIYVVAGFNPLQHTGKNISQYLIKQARKGIVIGSISNGAFVLAKAGLLKGYNATTHWEDFESFCYLFPETKAKYQRFVFDRLRMTCSGGTSTLDMFIEMVRVNFGDDLALRISRQMLLREFDHDSHKLTKPLYDGHYHYSPRVQHALSLLDAGVENKINVEKLANKVGVSRRELLRLFRKEIGLTPSALLIQRRLERARSLVLNTHLSLTVIWNAIGFSSQSHFTESYRQCYSMTPAKHRKNHLELLNMKPEQPKIDQAINGPI